MAYQPQGNPAPNWYPDPAGSGGMRYWDGSQWTQHLAPPPPVAEAPGAYPPATTPAAYPPATHPAYSPYYYPPGPHLAQTGGGKVYSTWGFVLGGIAFVLLPPIIGGAGVVCSIIGMTKKERLAPWALAVSIAGIVVGVAIGVVVWSHR
jgi:hypothetical protein